MLSRRFCAGDRGKAIISLDIVWEKKDNILENMARDL